MAHITETTIVLPEIKPKLNFIKEEIEIRPITAAEANSNLPGRRTPYPIPPKAIPKQTPEPIRQWDAHTAKRGLGFKSKIKEEAKENKSTTSNLIPESVRKQMKKYFG